MRKVNFILLFALCLSILSLRVYAAPVWSGNVSSTPTNYSSNTLSQFNVTWSGNVNMTFITITNSTTVLVNNVSMSNSTYGGDVNNYSIVLPAGTWNWTSYANDSSGNWSDTGNFTFTIGKANTTPQLNIYVDGVFSNKTVLLSTSNITASETASGDSGVVYTLWSNNSQLVNGSSVWNASSTQRGTYVYAYNTTGGENWSSGKTSDLYIFVTDLNFSGNSTNPSSSQSYSPTATYNFSINLTGNVLSIAFESNFLNSSSNNYTTSNSSTPYNITINNSSSTYWITFPALPVGTYQYRWIANDTNNFWNSTNNLTYQINASSITPSFTCSSGCLSGSGTSWTATTSTAVIIDCSDSHSLSLVFDICPGTIAGSGTNHTTCSWTTPSSSSSISFTCTASGNYTGSASATLTYATLVTSNSGSGTNNQQQNQTTTGTFTLTPIGLSETLEPGANKTITLTLNNPSSNDISYINITVSGINSTWYTLEKPYIAKLRHSGSNTTTLTLNIPSDAEKKTYTITVTAIGRDLFASRTITKQTSITLTVASEEIPANLTEGTNETTNQTLAEALGNETNQTGTLTGLSINPDDFKNIILFCGFVSAGLVFIFRNNVTDFLTGSKAKTHAHAEHAAHAAHAETPKKSSFLSSMKNKFSSLSEHRLVIHIKKKEEKEKEKDKA